MSYSEFSQKNFDQCRLSSALLELTYRCNLDCVFCYNDLGQKGTALSLENYQALLQGLTNLNTLSVTLSGGEPSVHRHFFSIGAYARELGFVIRIKSNGHSLRGKLIDRIKKEIDPYMIEISLHGATAATHDRLTCVRGSFERLVSNLHQLVDMGVRVKLNVPLTCWNADEIAEMYSLADGLAVDMQVSFSLSPRDNGDLSPLSLSASAEQRQRVREYLHNRANKDAAQRSQQDRSSSTTATSGKMNCGAGTNSLVVDPYGNVIACTEWRHPLGNLYENSIEEIWNGSQQLKTVRTLNEAAQQTRTKISRENGPVMFCPGLAERLTGNATAPYPGLLD